MRAAGKVHHPAPVVGVYLGAVRYGAQIDDTARSISADRVCATPKYVILKLTLHRVIYIPQEFADDPCLRSLSQEHEGKHADADAEALDNARPTFQAAVRAAIDRGTRNASATSAEAFGALSKAIQADVDGALDKMEAARKRVDDAIDSAAEIEHLQIACGGRAAQSADDE